MSKQKKQKPAPSVSHDLRREAKKIQKCILQEKSKNSVLHDERVFFKQMKSYVSFVASLSGAELKLPDLLQDYYMTIGVLRDTKIFVKKCDTYIDVAMVKVLCEEKLTKAKKQFAEFLKKHKSSLIAKQVRDYLTLIDARYKIFEPKWIQAGLQTYLTRQESIIKQHLLSGPIIEAVLHDIRKKIKKMIYLMPYLEIIHESKSFKKKFKTYKKLGEKIGSRNDLNHLVTELITLPREGDDKKVFEALQIKETRKRQELLEQLKITFGMGHYKIHDTTTWVNEKPPVKKTSPKQKKSPSTITEVVKNKTFSTKKLSASSAEKKSKKK